MEYTKEQIEAWKVKSESYDKLEAAILKHYGYEDENGDWIEYGDNEGGDLDDIGETVVDHFGF